MTRSNRLTSLLERVARPFRTPPAERAARAAEARRAALTRIAERRGWKPADETGDERVVGSIGDRRVEVAYVAGWTLLLVELRAVLGLGDLANWDPAEVGSHPMAAMTALASRALDARDLPAEARDRLGDTFEWLIDNSARITVAEGALRVDHPEVIDDGDTLDELVAASLEHAARLEAVLG